LLQPIKSATHILVVTCQNYGITAVVPQTSFHGETSIGVAKCQLFSQATGYQSNIASIYYVITVRQKLKKKQQQQQQLTDFFFLVLIRNKNVVKTGRCLAYLPNIL